MLSPHELQALLADLESDRVERTQSTTDTDKFSKAVCAFANDLPNHRKPGYLFVGVDNDGRPTGLKVTDQLLQNLGALRSDGNILPLPAISVSKVALPGGEVAVVEVRPSDLPPVRYKGQVWIRVGPKRAIASEQEERILSERRSFTLRTFDASPVPGSSLSDLSLALFAAYRAEVIAPEIIAANHRSIVEQLASLRFFDAERGTPTAAGLLLFAKNPRHFLPGAYIQFLRLPGETLTDRPDDQAEIGGDLLMVLRELDVRVSALVNQSLRPVSALREAVVADYPVVAIREILLNAVMHRDYQSNTPVRFYWYSDRIEIQSPGGLYGEVTPETLQRRSSYRNPVIAEAMKALGYVNRFGYGIQRAAAELRKNGNPEITFDIDERVFLATLRRRAT